MNLGNIVSHTWFSSPCFAGFHLPSGSQTSLELKHPCHMQELTSGPSTCGEGRKIVAIRDCGICLKNCADWGWDLIYRMPFQLWLTLRSRNVNWTD